MTTLVTGAGVIGSLVAAKLQTLGEKPVLFDVAFSMDNIADHVDLDNATLVRGDITDLAELLGAMREYGVDKVVHTASMLTSAVMARPSAGIRVMIMGSVNVLEAARLSGVQRMVSCSSGAVAIGVDPSPPDLDEDFSLRVVSQQPPSVYATSKLSVEWLAHHYYEQYGVRTMSLRLGGIFGTWRGIPSGGPSKLAQHLIESAWRNGKIELSADDLAHKGMDFLYAKDAASAAVLALHADNPPSSVFNISMGYILNVKGVIGVLSKALGREVELEVSTNEGKRASYQNDPIRFDLRRAREELGYEAEFPMEAAVADYFGWLERTNAGR